VLLTRNMIRDVIYRHHITLNQFLQVWQPLDFLPNGSIVPMQGVVPNFTLDLAF
jgi:hypothetical protein